MTLEEAMRLASDPAMAMEHLRMARAAVRGVARKDYRTWCEEVGRPRGWAPAAHHIKIIEAVERVLKGECPRLMINAPPGSAKSTYTSELLPAHVLSRFPGFNLIGASNTSTLAEDFSERTLSLIDAVPELMPFRLRKRSAPLWTTNDRGRYRAAGVGVAIAGNRADGVLIDDPVKSREAAESETQREKTWNWFISDLRTRLKPGAWIIVIMCMVGETPVRMADGTERPLREVRPGDFVASYDLEINQWVNSRVLNWASQGVDDVYEIKTTYGSAVRANERHPFLVERDGVLEWVKVKDLRVGDAVLRAPSMGATPARSGKADLATGTTPNARVCTPLGIVESSSGPYARQKGAPPPPSAKSSATRTMGASVGRTDTVLHPTIQTPTASATSSTATASRPKSTRGYMKPKAAFVQFAKRLRRICEGMAALAACVWTIATKPERFGGYYATPATSLLESRTPPTYLSEPPRILDSIRSIELVGREEVYDIEVEGTHNFVADSLCVSNTRWHEDDLGGRLLERQKGLWEVLNLPAQAYDVDPDTGLIPPDPLGRQPGEWLWSDDGYGYGEALQIIKREYEQAGAMRDWQALYQGRPTAGEGTVFKVAGLSVIDEEPVATPNVVRAWDLAATKKMGTADPDWTVGLKLMRTREDGYVILDVERLRGGPEDVERAIMDTAKRDGKRVAISLPQDPGQAGKSQALQLTKKLAGYRVTATVESGDKATRAAPAAAQVNIGNVAMLRGSWNAPFRAELAAFPAGAHDDMVDAFSRAFSMVALNRPLVVSNEALRDLRYGLRQGYQPRR